MSSLRVCSAEETAQYLPYPDLVDAIAQAARDLEAGVVTAPVRQMLPFGQAGVLLSMPCTAPDVGVHKLVNVMPANRARGLATIHGLVAVYDGETGALRALLDGPTVTARRTAAVSMLGLRLLCPQGPTRACVFGTGTQAGAHVQALAALYPGLAIDVIGRTVEKAQAFVQAWQETVDARLRAVDVVAAAVDVVITATTSATPVYDEAAQAHRVVIGVGAYRPDLAEIGARTLAGSRLYVDECDGARHEAGDYIQADIDWDRVTGLAHMLRGPLGSGAAVFKSVGCAAWDLAAARCAVGKLQG